MSSAPKPPKVSVLRLVWRIVRLPLLVALAAIVWFEEWGWRPLSRWVARFADWPAVARLEARIRRVPPRWALALFLAPSLLLVPVKLMAVWLVHLGHAGLGLAVIIAAKLVGTALVGRLFVVAESQLMQIAWFARALHRWQAFKVRVRMAWRASVVCRAMRRVRRRIAVFWIRLLQGMR